MSPIDRRDALKRLASIGAATTVVGSSVTSAAEYIEPDADAVYVWGLASDIILNSSARSTFFSDMDAVNASEVYFSWGAYADSSATGSDLENFVRDARDHGIEVHIMSGPTPGEDAPSTFYNDIMFDIIGWMNDHIQPDGIHLDIEPGDGDLATFLDTYETVLTQIETNDALYGVPLSVAWRDWWTQNELSKTKNVRDHSRVDFVVSMSYSDSESEIRTDTKETMMTSDGWLGRSYSSKEYVVAVEIQPGVDPDITLHEEGESATADILAALDSDPTPGNYRGTAIHYYGPLMDWA